MVARTIAFAVQNAEVTFGGVTALADVSVRLEGPSIVGIVGPNGSGKSTLIGVLSGMLKPSEGTVMLNGKELTGKSAIRFAHLGVRRSFQHVRLIPTLTVRDNLLVGVGRTDENILSQAQELSNSFGITEYLGRWPNEVPAGVQRLVQVASIVLTRPAVVLLDEPAAGLTEGECNQLSAVVRQVASTALVVVVEHNMQLMYDLADRVVALVNGQVVADGEVSSVRKNEVFQAAYLGNSEARQRNWSAADATALTPADIPLVRFTENC